MDVISSMNPFQFVFSNFLLKLILFMHFILCYLNCICIYFYFRIIKIFYGYNNKNIMKKGAIKLIWILIQESGNAVLTYKILL